MSINKNKFNFIVLVKKSEFYLSGGFADFASFNQFGAPPSQPPVQSSFPGLQAPPSSKSDLGIFRYNRMEKVSRVP